MKGSHDERGIHGDHRQGCHPARWSSSARQATRKALVVPAGGHVEPGERVEVALVREIAEELGTEAKITGLI
jgi:8-oxo-dGTP pyrophosphatase MutT (NUDIX family)